MSLAIEPGAEWCLPIAKKKLRELHDELVRMGLSVKNQRIPFPTGETIFIQSQRLMMPDGCAPAFIDTIRITGAAAAYFLGVAMSNPTLARHLYLSTVITSPKVFDGGGDLVGGASQLQVTLSDGTVLATQPQTIVAVPAGGHALSPVWAAFGIWDGSESAATINIATGGADVTIAFTVPPDVKSPTRSAREIARLKTSGDTALALLKSGALPRTSPVGWGGWAQIIKSASPYSFLPRQVSAFTATINTTPDPLLLLFLGTPFTEYDVTVSRSVTLQYTDAKGVLQQETIAGTWRQQEIKHSRTGGINYFSYVNTFTNFPAFGSNGPYQMGSATISNPEVGAFRDSFGTGLGVVIDGQNTYLGDSAGFVVDNYNTDPAVFYGYSPPVPALAINATGRVAKLYKQYHRDTTLAPVDVNTLPDPKPAYSDYWLSTAMVPGEIVSVVPFGPVRDGVDFGMFGDFTGAQQVAVYGVARFVYHDDGTFTFSSWRDGVPAAPATATAPAVVAGPKILDMFDDAGGAITWPGTNCIVKYTKFAWQDTRAAAATQAKALVAPTTNANKFLKLIKSAAGI